jgi:hypothetical protein
MQRRGIGSKTLCLAFPAVDDLCVNVQCEGMSTGNGTRIEQMPEEMGQILARKKRQ